MFFAEVFECQNCGREFSDTTDGIHYQCYHCGYKLTYNRKTGECIEDYSEIYECEDDDEVNPMCNACGNPDYPKCIDSCSRMED